MKTKDNKIMTLHPQGKKGVNISLTKYNIIKNFIIDKLKAQGDMTFEKLTDLAIAQLTDSFDGKVIWYVVTVKLDLEARKIITRIPKTSPHKLKLS